MKRVFVSCRAQSECGMRSRTSALKFPLQRTNLGKSLIERTEKGKRDVDRSILLRPEIGLNELMRLHTKRKKTKFVNDLYVHPLGDGAKISFLYVLKIT